MATKGLWILLFVAVQVSVGFCRSTETPIKNLKDIARVIDPADLPKILEVQNTKGVDINDTQHYPTGIPGKMSYDDYYPDYRHTRVIIDAYGIFAIIFSVFTIISLITGCICCCCHKNEPRRGFVVNSAEGQTTMMQQPATNPSGFVQPMQQYPPPYALAQQQNVYPPVQATKY